MSGRRARCADDFSVIRVAEGRHVIGYLVGAHAFPQPDDLGAQLLAA